MAVDTTAKAGLHKDYKHWVPDAPLNEDWDKELTFVLIRSLDELRVHDVEHRMVAWDTETSGFNPDTDWIVGFSFSFDGKTGYYVPVKHDDIALGKEALDIFHSILKKAAIQFLYNCRFDQRFMEAAGYSLDGLPYYDAMNAIWLADTNVVMPSLKACFTGDTLIRTEKGLRPISDVSVGDKVLSDGELCPVTDTSCVLDDIVVLEFDDGSVVRCTKDHLFLCEDGWVKAEDLMGHTLVVDAHNGGDND